MKMATCGGSAEKEESLRKGKLRGWGTPATSRPAASGASNVAGSLGARAGLFEAGEDPVHPTGT